MSNVVKYDAVKAGYSPPTEHLIIHELETGQARVRFRTTLGPHVSATLIISGEMDEQDEYELVEHLQWEASMGMRRIKRAKAAKRDRLKSFYEAGYAPQRAEP